MAGRTSKLTPERHEKIVAAIRAGNTREAAAGCGGIGERTLYRWLSKGEKARNGCPCGQLWQDVKNAENDAETVSVGRIRQAAVGGLLLHRETTIRELRDGTTQTTTKESFSQGQWQADAWWLERRRPDKWGRKESVDVTIRREAERIAKDLGMTTEAVIAEAERITQGK